MTDRAGGGFCWAREGKARLVRILRLKAPELAHGHRGLRKEGFIKGGENMPNFGHFCRLTDVPNGRENLYMFILAANTHSTVWYSHFLLHLPEGSQGSLCDMWLLWKEAIGGNRKRITSYTSHVSMKGRELLPHLFWKNMGGLLPASLCLPHLLSPKSQSWLIWEVN